MDIALDHPFCTAKRQVVDICKPLFLHTPFQYFAYQQYYFDGRYLVLSSETDFCLQVFKHDLLPKLKELQCNISHYFFLSPALMLPEMAVQKNKFIENIAIGREFKIYHRLHLTFNTSRCTEIFSFGLNSPVKNVLDVFMNHILLLEKFCVYFREAASNLIAQMKTAMLRYDDFEGADFFKDLNFKNDYSYTEFLKAIKIKNYRIQGGNGSCELSEREFECLLWSAKNKTAKQIASILSLSPRTVEAYFVTLKNKMGCESKSELMDIAFKNAIIKSLLE